MNSGSETEFMCMTNSVRCAALCTSFFLAARARAKSQKANEKNVRRTIEVLSERSEDRAVHPGGFEVP